ncbi:hypothetical protein [Alcanivorax quisquiliarum]|uniref:Uncharacterized protein n=1 Tax=Alcanivorax quisquiliarum TaxID=2933565 RepID=A0ABT0EA79_9GAMM|nr:hypothetical protein [Alcanivorax quisquiliarum]MCK0538741.1 hypothetical protein [Alcanivorax quisquiliarum]
MRLTYWLFRLWALPFRHKKYYKQLGLKPPSHVPEQVKAYERECLSWYVDETKALATEYRKRFPEITYINMTLSELNDAAKVEELLSLLGLKAGPELLQRLGVATNTKR